MKDKATGVCEQSWQKKSGLRACLSLFAVFLVYANLSTIFNSSFQQWRLKILPLSESVQDWFLICGVFSYYETNNTQMTLWGFSTDSATGEQNWKELSVQEYFPFSRGNQGSRMWASRQYIAANQKGQSVAWQFMGKRIKERYNKSHPDEPIEKVGFQSLTWPRSPNGFYEGRSRNDVKKEFWIISE